MGRNACQEVAVTRAKESLSSNEEQSLCLQTALSCWFAKSPKLVMLLQTVVSLPLAYFEGSRNIEGPKRTTPTSDVYGSNVRSEAWPLGIREELVSGALASLRRPRRLRPASAAGRLRAEECRDAEKRDSLSKYVASSLVARRLDRTRGAACQRRADSARCESGRTLLSGLACRPAAGGLVRLAGWSGQLTSLRGCRARRLGGLLSLPVRLLLGQETPCEHPIDHGSKSPESQSRHLAGQLDS